MSLFIVSDLHIWGPKDPIYRSLLNLIQHRTVRGDTLVLAGDLFDLFIGDKKIYRERYTEFFRDLTAAGQRGVSTHYIEGNHDFLMQKAFRQIPGFKLHPLDFKLEVQGKKFYFAHGDTVDRGDYGYRLLRIFFRSWIMKFLVTIVPGAWLDHIGRISSRRSRAEKPVIPLDLPLEKREYLRTTFRSYAAERLAEGNDFVVMGHCHDLDEMSFKIGGRPGQYVNVGYPRVHGSFLSWAPGEEKIQREKLPDAFL